MRILAVAAGYPMYDRAAGYLRFSQLLGLLASKYEVHFCPHNPHWYTNVIGKSETARYRSALENLRVIISEKHPVDILKTEQFDVILFEFYNIAQRYLNWARRLQPRSRIVVDSVDVHFHRLFGKARVTNDQQDLAQAKMVKRAELAAYAQADVVLTVTEADKKVLLQELRSTDIAVIPCIQTIPPRRNAAEVTPNTLLFIGYFTHEPNVDAMVYFCRDVMPLIGNVVPDVRLRIIGASAPHSVTSFANDHVEVLGFVPDTTPYLRSSHVSIAPLRYGGGMKGKVVEAMSHALPVVTTSPGIEGIGLSPGEDVLIGDTPQSFAEAVIRLLTDPQLCERIGEGGWQFVQKNYSTDAVAGEVFSLFDGLARHTVKRLPFASRVKGLIPESIRHELYWRFLRTPR
jgi:glycosyltransferase involved in cell wall biosynthesis